MPTKPLHPMQAQLRDDLLAEAKAAERHARALELRSSSFKFFASVTLTCAIGLAAVAYFAASAAAGSFAMGSAAVLGAVSLVGGLVSFASHQAAENHFKQAKANRAHVDQAAELAMEEIGAPLVGKQMASTVIVSKKRNAEQMWVEKVAIGAQIPHTQLDKNLLAMSFV